MAIALQGKRLIGDPVIKTQGVPVEEDRDAFLAEAADDAAKVGSLSIRLGLGWAKSHAFYTGQCPVMKYNHGLMKAILHDKVHIGDAVNATVISLEDAPKGYKLFHDEQDTTTKIVLKPDMAAGATA